MAEASYNRQHLATHAAGFINGAGTTQITFGCQMTRLSQGHYALLLGADVGLVDDDSFTQVTVKGDGTGDSIGANATVNDVSNVQKDIFVRSLSSLADLDIEVIVWKSVTQG